VQAPVRQDARLARGACRVALPQHRPVHGDVPFSVAHRPIVPRYGRCPQSRSPGGVDDGVSRGVYTYVEEFRSGVVPADVEILAVFVALVEINIGLHDPWLATHGFDDPVAVRADDAGPTVEQEPVVLVGARSV